jgi:amino acid adenylation domain-containing protein
MPNLLHQLLSESAARRPDAEAVRLLDEAISYDELESQSNQLAHALIACGVVPGDRVGLYVKKSPAAIVAIFGILKTGASYVPVDASAPGPRLLQIAQRSSFRALITSASLYENLKTGLEQIQPPISLFFVDRTPPGAPQGQSLADLKDQPRELPTVEMGEHDLAYILFTSGSTGTPKGVMLSHLNALTFVNWAVRTFDITDQDRLSNHASFSFDLSVLDIFAAIKAGAAISLVPENLAVFPLQLSSFIQKQKITIWYSVPMALMLMLARGKLGEGDFSSLRWILFAGEVFPTKHLRELMQVLPGPRYANLYGPTETNVCAYYEVGVPPEDVSRPIPIGKACADTELIAIDAQGQRVSRPGTEGLLHARGPAVMQGYFGMPAETAAAFSSSSQGTADRMYATGDWVTLDEQGNYHFVGRKDSMIKIRGYRVELGEIEVALGTHPAVDEAVALAIPDEAIGNTIRAVVTLAPNQATDSDGLKRHCSQKLPPYMVPDRIDVVENLPRTGNGKIDRRRLLAERTSH